MKFLARRFAHSLIILLAISFLSFLLLQWAPGDYFDAMRMNPRVSAQTVETLRAEHGVGRSFPVRYALWMHSLVKGDMGVSFAYGTPVGPLLWPRARNTLLLTGCSMIFAWLFAVPLGVWSAASKNSWLDRICSFATSTLLVIPDLLLFLLLLLLAVRTGWFPSGGMVSSNFEDLSFWQKSADVALHFALPALGLAAVSLPLLLRHVRAAMIEVLDSPFIRSARGHGIPRSRLLWRYALPAASNPLISLFGLSIATMLSGSLIVEVILSWPGLGPLMIQAILSRDVNVVIGVVMLSSVFLLAGNLIADVLLFASDPRIRVE
ncbi:MAG: ABC transporter permease [Candidatus Acidiferrales bacterium]